MTVAGTAGVREENLVASVGVRATVVTLVESGGQCCVGGSRASELHHVRRGRYRRFPSVHRRPTVTNAAKQYTSRSVRAARAITPGP
jgi:hypothetical protein